MELGELLIIARLRQKDLEDTKENRAAIKKELQEEWETGFKIGIDIAKDPESTIIHRGLN